MRSWASRRRTERWSLTEIVPTHGTAAPVRAVTGYCPGSPAPCSPSRAARTTTTSGVVSRGSCEIAPATRARGPTAGRARPAGVPRSAVSGRQGPAGADLRRPGGCRRGPAHGEKRRAPRGSDPPAAAGAGRPSPTFRVVAEARPTSAAGRVDACDRRRHLDDSRRVGRSDRDDRVAHRRPSDRERVERSIRGDRAREFSAHTTCRPRATLTPSVCSAESSGAVTGICVARTKCAGARRAAPRHTATRPLPR